MYIPEEIEGAIDNLRHQPIDSKVRVVHRFKHDGSPCSVGKDAALSVTKQVDHYSWYCFRCHQFGRLFGGDSSPKSAAAIYRDIPPEEVRGNYNWIIPANVDHISASAKVPQTVWDDFLRRARFAASDIYNNLFFWHGESGRIIMPVQLPSKNFTENCGEVHGYVARCPRKLTKEERFKYHRPKYIVRRNPEHGRLFYLNDSSLYYPDRYVIVEDIYSAMRVNRAVHCKTIALITTSICDDLVVRLPKDAKISVWLDHDARMIALEHIRRLSLFGFNVRQVETEKDPKAYNNAEIMKYLKDAWKQKN